ncbi:ABC transporter substrate-binding protein [Thermococcus waiotapuensis]|uniref:ABC transporter substrate-binding protein n=1 Tax=Thermococcus waiotapuensis TaxID=90909 RepID=A0AAE4NWB1_9EURY|nr:ABC transporter substrate-binding protein [Thermococcus waiotapuensis]MDV3103892.1 ABC transporter substrate-binding protein [Thermococcus waiotapuensis]
MKWEAALVVGVLLVSVLGAGCMGSSNTSEKTTTPKEITVEDFAGRNVTVRVPVQRAVIMSTSVLEIVQLLNASDQVVGIPEEAKDDVFLSPGLKNKTVVGKMLNVNDWEKVLALNPDLIVNFYLKKFYDVDEFLNRSASYNIPVIMLREDNLEDVTKAIELLGKIFGKEKEAQAFEDYFNEQVSRVKAITSKIPSEDRKKVIMIEPIMGKYYLVNGNDVLAQAVSVVGADYLVNLTFTGYTPVRVPMDKEKIIADYKDADVVILLTDSVTPYEKVEELKNEMLNDDSWKLIKAVGEGNVFVLRADKGKDSFLIWSPRMAVGVWILGKVIYPDYYPDWEGKAKEFVERFYPFLS